MKFSEIGSYFWLDGSEETGTQKNIQWLPAMEDECFTFSGRNAIDIVIRDIQKKHRVDIVYVPSYCCESMLQEFIDRELKIEFYNVGYEKRRFTYQQPKCGKNSVVLIMSYFGLDTSGARKLIQKAHEAGSVVIEDITHSLLRKDAVSDISDYAVASLRKWFPIPTGGLVGIKKGVLSEKPTIESNHVVEEKIAAMHEKYDYLTGKIKTKENFLLAQAKFENDLIYVDRLLEIDDMSLGIAKSIDVYNVVNQRRRNARILIEGLSDMETLVDIPQVDLSVDVPLFLPIIMDSEKRDSLREYLIDRGIYCPVHWPEVIGAEVGIRENELSLICDQRYSDGDMRAIVNAVHEWIKP
ncbi:MAG: hypothetical protein HFI93_00610 [Lachnospiraceae bacterium]|nr:hypothetical protein [Lachnospiraceae bacterium]